MLETLREFINEFPDDRKDWKSLFIDYEKPHVERLWTQWKDYRVYLHKIHPCEKHEVLYHPHPWPSAMLICSGQYETGLGYGDPFGEKPPIIGPFYLAQWSAYQMLNPNEWHYVRPIERSGWAIWPCYTIMITGKLYPEKGPKEPKPKMRELTEGEIEPIWEFFTSWANQDQMMAVLDRWNLHNG